MLTIEKIIKVTEALLISNEIDIDLKVNKGFASDLMSDVLKIDESDLLLLTGLCNLQTIRTAEMSDINFILFVRNKKPTQKMINLANENNITLLTSSFSMFKTSGLLYEAGLKSVY